MANSKNYSVLNGKLNITGSKILQFRQKSKLSRQALSNKLMIMGYDISANSIYDIEVGARSVADFEICAIAKALELPVQNFLEDYYNTIEKM